MTNNEYRNYEQTKRSLRCCFSPASSIAGRTVIAHHAFGAEFDPNAPIRLQGKVVRLEWVNPHTWIHVETVKDGKPEIWMVEGGTPNTLLRRGITRDTVAVGTEVDRRRLPDQGSLAEARQRPRRHVRRRPQAVHGIVGHRRPARRQRPDRGRHQAGAEEARRQVDPDLGSSGSRIYEKPIQRPAAATVTHSAIDSAPTSIWRRAVLRTVVLAWRAIES